MYDYIVQSLVVASSDALKCIKCNGSGLIWTQQLSSLKADSRSALHNWQNAGCPVNNELFVKMQDAKRLYKKALKNQKNLSQSLSIT